MLDSEEGGVERTKISMRSYFFFCLHLYYTMKLWTFEQSRWAKGMLLDLASHIATTDMCQFKIASSKLAKFSVDDTLQGKFLGLQWIIYANHEDSKEELQGLCG